MVKAIILVLTLAITLTFLSTPVDAATRVKGYTKKSGTYVAPHYKSKKDTTKFNNYSTKGNYNPYTGKKGYKSAYKY